MKLFRIRFLVILFLAACTAPNTSPETSQGVATNGEATTAQNAADVGTVLASTSTVTPNVAETAEPATVVADQPPAAFPAAGPTTASGTPITVNGRTDEGAYFLGRSDAPVTLIDYSDFL